jgi:hypothetical protein
MRELTFDEARLAGGGLKYDVAFLERHWGMITRAPASLAAVSPPGMAHLSGSFLVGWTVGNVLVAQTPIVDWVSDGMLALRNALQRSRSSSSTDWDGISDIIDPETANVTTSVRD